MITSKVDGGMDLTMSDRAKELRSAYGAFMDEFVIPREHDLKHELDNDKPGSYMKQLQEEAKKLGLWAPHLPAEAGGMGLSLLDYAYVNEIVGRSTVAPRCFGANAPDSGNAEILHLFGTPEQKETWLKPLVAGEIRSCFSMTEPDVGSSDPTQLETKAVRDGDEYVINGHKWFTSGAVGAAFAIAMVKTDEEAPRHRRMSQIIVPTNSPGFVVERSVPVWGDYSGRHYEVTYDNVRVPVTNVLGEEGDGFLISQKRLGPGRIHHVMRTLGSGQRAFDLMCHRALDRTAHGGLLADKGVIQQWIAESVADLQSARMLTLRAAAVIDRGEDPRVDVSMIKWYAVRAVGRVIDRAVQVHGALGVTADLPLEAWYRGNRTLRIADGPDEVHQMVVARAVLRKYRAGEEWSFV